MKSGFSVEERARLVSAWKGSGLSAAEFSEGHPGLTKSLLANWQHRAAGPDRRLAEAPATKVHLTMALDIATYAPLARAAADLSLSKGVHITTEEYAAAALRHLLTGAPKAGKVRKAGNPQKEIDGTPEKRPGRGPKGRGGRARGAGPAGHQVAAGGAARGAGSTARKGPRRQSRAGQAASAAECPWNLSPPGPIAARARG